MNKGNKLPKEVKKEVSDTVTSDDLSLEELHKIFEEKEITIRFATSYDLL